LGITNGFEIELNICRRDIERDPGGFFMESPAVFIDCPAVFIDCPAVFIDCPAVFID
jgi:hypothetical protein